MGDGRDGGVPVTRRAALPGAAELFRSTSVPGVTSVTRHAASPSTRTGTGRQKHSSKITVYVTDEELLALEHARLALRANHGLVVDRGRVVREAVAVLLADFEERGDDSVLVRRLRQDIG
jgi:L-aminopeptidase/D-esterase-like protein